MTGPDSARILVTIGDPNRVGPEGGDVLLVREGYDAFVAMYHDHGHIPVKLVAGRSAPVIRTIRLLGSAT